MFPEIEMLYILIDTIFCSVSRNKIFMAVNNTIDIDSIFSLKYFLLKCFRRHHSKDVNIFSVVIPLLVKIWLLSPYYREFKSPTPIE
jgi:hypothetical protein